MGIRRFFLILAICSAVAIGTTEDSYAQRKVKVSKTHVMSNSKPYILHTYRRRELLRDIATAYDTSVEAILSQNPQIRSGLKPGQKILIPQWSPEAEAAAERQRIADSIQMAQDSIAAIIIEEEKPVEFGLTAPVDKFAPIQVALLLPLDKTVANRNGFVEVMQGALLAFEDLTLSGADIDVHVIATDKSTERAMQIIESGRLEGMNLIIGPVYPQEFDIIAEYGAENRIPVVSPLGNTGKADNPFVVQISPDKATKWDKLGSTISDPLNNVVMIEHQSLRDTAMINDLSAMMSPMVKRIAYTDKTTNIETIEKSLSSKSRNVIIVPVENEIAVEEILSRISSMNVNNRYDIQVIGNSSWARFTKLNQDLFFGLEVTIPSSYFYDHTSLAVAPTHRRYINKYGEVPSLFSMRGYDVAMLMGRLVVDYGHNMMYELVREVPTPLQTPYEFTMTGNETKVVNEAWAIVHYMENYSIAVE